MAKAKKRVAARKKTSKRGKANAKPARKLAAKQATPRKAKSKVKRTAVSAKKPAAKKKRPPEPVNTMQVAAMPIETKPMDVIDEPAPRCNRSYGARVGSDSDLHFDRRPALSKDSRVGCRALCLAHALGAPQTRREIRASRAFWRRKTVFQTAWLYGYDVGRELC
jgi:hypothetical protein